MKLGKVKSDTSVNFDTLIEKQQERTKELKESLKYVSTLSEEMLLLKDLSEEITELRALRELRFSDRYLG
ncbi:MAG TPA: hypothetical protein VFQ92_04040 [Blastocatellia bacterium]|nr:hypothetical protein [Blastocatellia bacterium]